MAFFPTYPLVFYPDSIKNYLAQQSNSKVAPQAEQTPVSLTYQTSKIAAQRFDFRNLIKGMRFLGWLFSGVVGFSLAFDLLQGASWVSLLPGIFLLVLKTMVMMIAIAYIKKLEQAQNQDLNHQQQQYWQQKKQSNQNYHRQVQQQVKQKFVRANPQLGLRKRNNSLRNYQLKRGVFKEEAQKGVSEGHFLEYLRKYFAEGEITCDYFALNDRIGYTTDFSLIINNIGFDIEIDEPYTGKSKQPHHCQDDHRDRNRNNYFLDRGWIVVRFSEYQVVRYPHSCCKTIATILDLLGESQYLEPLSSIETLPEDETWSKAGATAMASRKYRELYLDQAGLFKYHPNREKGNQKGVKPRRRSKSSRPKHKLKLRKN